MTRTLAALMIAVAMLASSSARAEATLKVGDPAPPLAVDKWLKDGPIAKLEPGTIYVIECWATWCGPCIASMPHVTKLQAKFKDKKVVVIGVDVWERDAAAPEPFVKKMGDKMGYAVVTDDTSAGPQEGKMATTWLKAAGQNGIPCSFLVDRKGKIAWIGHPMMMERPLSQLADDKFDPAEQKQFDDKLQALSQEFSASVRSDVDKALTTLDQMAVLNPSMTGQYSTMKVSLLVEKKDFAGANALAAEIGNKSTADDASQLAGVANALLTAGDQKEVDAALALKLATKALEGEKDSWQLQSLVARAHAANKQFDKAADLMTKAIESAPQQLKAQFEKLRDEYREGKAGGTPEKKGESKEKPAAK